MKRQRGNSSGIQQPKPGNIQRRLPLFQGLLPFKKSALSGDVMSDWSQLSTRRSAAPQFRVDDAAFGDQRLRTLPPNVPARWR
jgi:hypothetical protein